MGGFNVIWCYLPITPERGEKNTAIEKKTNKYLNKKINNSFEINTF